MKKMTTLMTVISLALPLAFATPLAASAATKPTTTAKPAKTTKGMTYTIAKNGASFFKTAKAYHTTKTAPTVYKALIAADSSNVTFTAKGKLKASTTYYVTQSIKTAATKTQKSQTFLNVKGQGWVLASGLTAGKMA
ncbi:hypothetical protein FEZ41_07955 [Lentilactobacillus parafarraginis]|jgi:hypothetical protein|uniref:Surface layer protein A domain-containing protein n=3 Tax=Lentilactobacillus parafarraginis TaxID=390842 RepID=A0A0R1Z0Z0_9LACO|nr:hypothetical protein [Lentilactobacillus parafarraginis]EHM00508.1 hypothetical protein HMPREF9103_00514 [Lentilactobacillus parafarraginis F0439]KRM45547.1 hypothetical protein FD47_GL001380 [Lentilactobacillus parafarraginis DSM 18390 = JCM 14109]TLQ19202.1 hypothetical protein FEZ41_07955 [Lentilactobacillus parafarraginis]